MYAFTDSSHFHEVWLAHLEETIEQYQENMNKRKEMAVARMNRRALRSLSRHSFETSGSSTPATPSGDALEGEGGEARDELIDVKFVW